MVVNARESEDDNTAEIDDRLCRWMPLFQQHLFVLQEEEVLQREDIVQEWQHVIRTTAVQSSWLWSVWCGRLELAIAEQRDWDSLCSTLSRKMRYLGEKAALEVVVGSLDMRRREKKWASREVRSTDDRSLQDYISERVSAVRESSAPHRLSSTSPSLSPCSALEWPAFLIEDVREGLHEATPHIQLSHEEECMGVPFFPSPIPHHVASDDDELASSSSCHTTPPPTTPLSDLRQGCVWDREESTYDLHVYGSSGSRSLSSWLSEAPPAPLSHEHQDDSRGDGESTKQLQDEEAQSASMDHVTYPSGLVRSPTESLTCSTPPCVEVATVSSPSELAKCRQCLQQRSRPLQPRELNTTEMSVGDTALYVVSNDFAAPTTRRRRRKAIHAVAASPLLCSLVPSCRIREGRADLFKSTPPSHTAQLSREPFNAEKQRLNQTTQQWQGVDTVVLTSSRQSGFASLVGEMVSKPGGTNLVSVRVTGRW